MNDASTRQWVWFGAGAAAPLAAGIALVPFRQTMRNANVALLLVGVVVLIAAGGGRAAGAIAAVSSAVSFDVFHTRPYLHLNIAARDDLVTTVILLAVGLLVGTVSARGRRATRAAEERRGEVRRLSRLARSMASGDVAEDVIMGAQAELSGLLKLSDCRFEAPPFASALARLERSGTVSIHDYRMRDGAFEIPADGLELLVSARGQTLGRFVLRPLPGTAVTIEQRVAAVALADQVGAVLAAPTEGDLGHG